MFIVSLGTIVAVGIEGTVFLRRRHHRLVRSHGVLVKEVICPNRKTRRGGKSDPIDACAAAKSIAAYTDDLPNSKLHGEAIDGLCVPEDNRQNPNGGDVSDHQLPHYRTDTDP